MTQTILELAQQRGAALPYAGAVTPHEAYQLLLNDATVHLIDVRTNAERDWVGQVQIKPEQLHAVQWNLYPSKSNPDFLTELAQSVSKETVLLFLCRSGVRSKAAAQLATEQGYLHCYDILEGFEGDKDGQGHRKSINGWCYAGLPWRGA
jgi:rhodanese-related sulfurtransferase